MMRFMRKFLVTALASRREYTEDLLRKLWYRETGGSGWDEMAVENGINRMQVENIFDIIDERYGEDILSGNDEVARQAMKKSLLLMVKFSDRYRIENEQKITNNWPSR